MDAEACAIRVNSTIPDAEWPRASEADKAWQRGDLGRLHELYKKPIEATARKVAVEFRIPWTLSELRKCGQISVYKLRNQLTKWERLGIPLSKPAPNFIARAVRKCGESIRDQSQSGDEEREPPSPECIQHALETFDKEEWDHFIRGFYREDLKLFSHLDDHRNGLKQHIGAPKFNGIYGAAVLRGMSLFFRHPEKIEVLHIWAPLRALRLWQESRALNRRGLSSSGQRRTTAEMGGARGIASQLTLEAKTAGLKLYDKKVTKWLNSFEEEPFDNFEGNLSEYVLKKCYPKAYKRMRR